jgi:hypothetical protein
MDRRPATTERRRHHRVPASGRVVLHVHRAGLAGLDIHGQLVALGVNDLEVQCDLGFRLLSMAGVAVDVDLSLEGDSLRFLPLRGHVTHVRAASHSLVVRLTDIPSELAAVIEESLAHPERGATEAVVVV